MAWMNEDGLYVKFGTEEAHRNAGGEYNAGGNTVSEIEFVIDYTDALSATASILGTADNPGSFGVVIPKGMFIEEIQTIAEEAFTSSGTIGSASLVLGLVAEDRSTTYDPDGFLTSSFAGGAFDAAGEKTTVSVGSTGAGVLIGTVLANDGIIVVANAGHASHPLTAGKLRVRVRGYIPTP